MASQIPLMPFLRPLGLPRSSSVWQLLRFSTSTRCNAQRVQGDARTAPRQERTASQKYSPTFGDPNLAASLTASPSYPPPNMKSLPRPKVSKASRRTAHPPKQRNYPTRQPSHNQIPYPKLIPGPVESLPAPHCAPNLAYFVSRTKSNELPVYQDSKRGGNMKLTMVRKIDGEVEVLRDALRETLNLKKEECVVNPVTRQVVMKGYWKGEVDKYLRERMF